jgi:hypothetical protein
LHATAVTGECPERNSASGSCVRANTFLMV